MNKKSGLAQVYLLTLLAIAGLYLYEKVPSVYADWKLKHAVKDTQAAANAATAANAAAKKATEDAEAKQAVKDKQTVATVKGIQQDAVEGQAALEKLATSSKEAKFAAERLDNIHKNTVPIAGEAANDEIAAWRKLALDAISGEAAAAKVAQDTIAKQDAANATLAAQLTETTKETLTAKDEAIKSRLDADHANQETKVNVDKLTAAEKKNEELNGLWGTVKRWAFYAILAWGVLQLLTLFARFNPALMPFVTAIHSVTAPALAFVHAGAAKALDAAKAEASDLASRVGHTIAELKQEASPAVKTLVSKLDSLTDKDQQAIIKKAADAKLAELRAAAVEDATKAQDWLAAQLTPAKAAVASVVAGTPAPTPSP